MSNKKSEKELVLLSKEQLTYFANYYLNNTNAMNDVFDNVHFWISKNEAPNMFATDINKKIEIDTDMSKDELLKNPADFYSRRISAETQLEVIPKLIAFVLNNDHYKILNFNQSIKHKANENFTEHLTFSKILGDGKTLNISIPHNNLESFIKKRLFGNHPMFNKYYNKFITLSKREKSILKLVSEGDMNKEIGEKLYISPLTVKTHRKNICRKLDTNKLAELIKISVFFDLIEY